MTTFEIITVITSVLALIAVAPLVAKIFKKHKIQIETDGEITIGYNFDCVEIRATTLVESKNASMIVNNLQIEVYCQDNTKKLLNWGKIWEPSVLRNTINNDLVKQEHFLKPFKINENAASVAHIQFYDNTKWSEDLKNKIDELIKNNPDAKTIYDVLSENKNEKHIEEIKRLFLNNSYWVIGKYKVRHIVNYNSKKTSSREYNFEINKEQCEKLNTIPHLISTGKTNNITIKTTPTKSISSYKKIFRRKQRKY